MTQPYISCGCGCEPPGCPTGLCDSCPPTYCITVSGLVLRCPNTNLELTYSGTLACSLFSPCIWQPTVPPFFLYPTSSGSPANPLLYGLNPTISCSGGMWFATWSNFTFPNCGGGGGAGFNMTVRFSRPASSCPPVGEYPFEGSTIPGNPTAWVLVNPGTVTVTICDGPPDPLGACCLPNGSCETTTHSSCQSLGGTWNPGITCANAQCPPPVDPLGACCRPDGTCNERTQSSCNAAGFTWLGANSSCTPNPCVGPVMHSCCIAGQCFNQDEPTCLSNGGLYQGAVQCGQALPCPGFNEVGPCCTSGGECFTGTHTQCLNVGGNWLGPGHTCFDCTAPRLAARSRGLGDTLMKALAWIGVKP